MEKPWMSDLVEELRRPSEKEPETERSTVLDPSSDRVSREVDPFRPLTSALEYRRRAYADEPQSEGFLSHLAAVIAVILLLAVAIGALSFYKEQVGRSLIRLGERLSGEPAPSPTAGVETPNPGGDPKLQPTSQSVPSSEVSPSDAPIAPGSPGDRDASVSAASKDRASSDKASSAGASSDRATSASQESVQQPPVESSKGDDNGLDEYSLAHESLSQARTGEAKLRAAGLLWMAVEKGSSDAEIELADLYGRGDGVPKNCQQARILLAAARNGHNRLAGKESAELNVYGCR